MANVVTAPQQSDNDPSYQSSGYLRQRASLQVVRDVWGGTMRMRARAAAYLPRFPLEPEDAYLARLGQAVLYNAFGRTVRGLAGMVFRKDLLVTDEVPPRIVDILPNIDRTGQSLDVVSRDLLEAMLIDGHVGLFIDRPVKPAAVQSLRDEETARLEPYWMMVPKEDILSWVADTSTGRVELGRVAFRRFVCRPKGEFGDEEVEQVRSYRRSPAGVEFAVYERKTGHGIGPLGQRLPFATQVGATGASQWQEVERGLLNGVSRIPFLSGYASRRGFFESEPPLIDLALENILHYQVRSDRLNSLHIAGVPIPVFIGLDDPSQEIAVGADMAVKLPLGGDAKYLEAEGTALNELRHELTDIERRMAALGLSMLMQESRAAETAEAKRIDHSLEQVTLSSVASGLEDLLNAGLDLHAEWLAIAGEEGERGGSVAVNRDFEKQMLGPQEITALTAAVGEGMLSLETLWEILVKGEILPDGFDADTERERLADTKELLPFVAAAANARMAGGNGAAGGAGGVPPGRPTPASA